MMKTTIKTRKNAWKSWVVCFMAFSVFALLAGCAGNYGRLERDAQITDSFMAAQVLPDYNYYYSGSQGEPAAILGIHKDYKLQEKLLWVSIKPTRLQLVKWISEMGRTDEDSLRNKHYGYGIYGPDGNQVGIWYSRLGSATVLKGVDNEVIVYTPNKFDREERLRGRGASF